jgi:hypothetical protein
MPIIIRSTISLFGAVALLLAMSATHVHVAHAEKTKSIKTEGKFVSWDAESKMMKVKVKKTGKKAKDSALRLKTGKEAEFRVKPEGSVLKRTSVTLNGKRAAITDIPEGKTLNIYWVPDEQNEGMRFARKIDMILTDQELEARDKARMEAEKAAGRVAED